MNRHEEQHTEESIARMMRQCAGEEGSLLLQSFAQENPQTLPGELDEKCKALIEKDFHRRQSRATAGSVIKTLCLTVLCLFGLVGVGTITALSVETLRQPVINYFVSLTEDSLVYIGDNSLPHPPIHAPNTALDLADPLGHMLSDDYTLIKAQGTNLDSYQVFYEDSANHYIVFSSFTLDGVSSIDTEGAQVIEQMVFCGCPAYLIIEDSTVRFAWVDETVGVSCLLSTNGHSAEEVQFIAQQLIQKMHTF